MEGDLVLIGDDLPHLYAVAVEGGVGVGREVQGVDKLLLIGIPLPNEGEGEVAVHALQPGVGEITDLPLTALTGNDIAAAFKFAQAAVGADVHGPLQILGQLAVVVLVASNPYSFKNTNNQLLAQAKKNAQLSNSANSYYKSRRAIPTIELTGVSNAQRSNKGLKPLAGIGNFKQKGNELIHPITYNTVKSNDADQKINEDLTSKPTLNTEKAQQDVNQSIADTLLEMQTRDTKGSNVNNENNAF